MDTKSLLVSVASNSALSQATRRLGMWVAWDSERGMVLALTGYDLTPLCIALPLGGGYLVAKAWCAIANGVDLEALVLGWLQGTGGASVGR